jgi:hypothetical protein
MQELCNSGLRYIIHMWPISLNELRMIGSRNNRKNLEEDILLNMEDDIVDEKIEE